MGKITKALLVGFLLSFFGTSLLTSRVYADPLGNITSYQVPNAQRNYGITQGPDGNIWFTQETAKKIWKFSPGQTTFTDYNVDVPPSGDVVQPNQIVNGPDGSVWSAMVTKIGKMDIDGSLNEYSFPAEGSHKFSTSSIAVGPDGRIWALAWNSNTPVAQNVGIRIFVLNSDGSIFKKIAVTTGGQKYPATITTDQTNGRIWYAYHTSNYPNPTTSTIGYYDVDSGDSGEWTSPIGSISDGIVTPDGKFWFVGDLNKINSVDGSGLFGSNYTLPTPSGAGIFKLSQDAAGYTWGTIPNAGKVARIDTSDLQNFFVTNLLPGGSGSNGANPMLISAGIDGNMWVAQGGNTNARKITKIGTGVSQATLDTDTDGDGLTKVRELQQGTSDHVADTDRDGLNDYIESQWFTGRDDVFCGSQCAYPEPLQKDLYVEVDWMVKPGGGGYSMEPNAAQRAALISTYSDRGIRIHIDTGQNGGGNEVPYNTPIKFEPQSSVIDFYDYKEGGDGITAQFDAARYHIWHYMISGYSYSEFPTSSGVSYAGDDDTFVSYGLIKETFGVSSLDTAIAGTMIHELGHNLCLTPIPAYSGQPASCRFAGIDNLSDPYNDYESSMNYTYQLDMVDYSFGINGGPGDHNDWAAIRPQDFINQDTGDISHGKRVKQTNKIRKSKLMPNITAKQYRDLKVNKILNTHR